VKPVTGETLFRRESGAVASQFHDPPSIEPYSSALVATERGIVLGKKSGLARFASRPKSSASTCRGPTPTCSHA
jgi:D-citramalate synthase/methanogen homocitrate synthase